MVLIGITICLVSIIPDATCGNMGVNKKKLSSLTITSSISGSSPNSDSNFLAHSTPAKPPPKITTFFLFLANCALFTEWVNICYKKNFH